MGWGGSDDKVEKKGSTRSKITSVAHDFCHPWLPLMPLYEEALILKSDLEVQNHFRGQFSGVTVPKVLEEVPM